MQIFTAYCWEKGLKTEKNQDSLAICQMVVKRKRCLLAVVCDGIGSFKDSEKASGYVTEQMIGWFYRAGPKLFGTYKTAKTILNMGKKELYKIHGQLKKYSMKNDGLNLGCTLSMLLVIGRIYYIWNVGDSRIYLGRRKNIHALTKDDLLRGMLTRCIGSFSWKNTFSCHGKIRRKDTFLVCSDGFYRRISEQNLRELLAVKRIRSECQAKRCLQEIEKRNRARGEKDDSTAVFIQFM